MVETDGGGSDELHTAAFEQRTVAPCTGAHKQGVGIMHQLGGKTPACGIHHFVGKALYNALHVWYFFVNNNFHGLKMSS